MIDTSADTPTAATGTVVRTAVPSSASPAGTGRAKPRETRLRALDGLRLVAALMVAGYHYGGRGGEVTRAWGSSPRYQFPTLHTLFAYGSLGVQVFFVISGFVICMSGWGRSLRSFFASRAARLLPAYWAALVLVTAVMALPFLSFKTVTPTETLLNFSMLQLPAGAHRVLGVCWTLWAEVRFYALFALCIVIPGATRRRVIMFCACWTLAVAISGGLDQPLLEVLAMPDYAPFFIGGVGLYLVHRDRTDPYAWGIVGVSWCLAQYAAVRTHWHPWQADQFSYRSAYGIILVVTLAFLAVAAIGLGWLDWANWRWLTVAGALTYPFYLVHEHLGWVVIEGLHRGLGVPSYATFVLTAASMLLLAWLLNRFVERRFTPRLRSVLAKPRE
ncbi:acyltransferase family protein [Streptomyces sp. MS06]|uniref:acyltransferase family protein n=1 Tax=Streptomyces sp. MS06 TaxID=3385974 RepID=UPI0039A2F6D9